MTYDERADDRSDARHSKRAETNHREYLKLAGTATVGAVGSTAATGLGAAVEDSGIAFERRVNVVEKAGCDPSGGESCHEKIMRAADDGVLLVFPAGEYLIEEPISLSGYERVGIVGTGDVTFLFPSSAGDDIYLDVQDVGTFLYRNIDWDITAPNCAPGIVLGIEEHFFLGQLEVLGRGDASGGGFALQPAIQDESGLGVVEEFIATKGSKFESAPRGGVLVSSGRNYGTLRFVNCQLEEFENNGLYAAASAGPIQVKGGVYRNNMRSQLRFSGEGSYIDGALVEVDVSKIPEEAEPAGFRNGRGIWWESKNTDPLRTGGEIRNTEVVIRQGATQTQPNTGGAVVIRRDGGACTIRDSRIRMDVTPRPAVYAKAPTGAYDPRHSAPPEPHAITMENVAVVGAAKDQFCVQIEGRPNSVIRDCYLEQRFRYGIVLSGCDGSIVENTELSMQDAPQIALWGSEGVTIENVTSDSPYPLVIGDADFEDEDGRGPPEDGDRGRGPPENGNRGRGPSNR